MTRVIDFDLTHWAAKTAAPSHGRSVKSVDRVNPQAFADVRLIAVIRQQRVG